MNSKRNYFFGAPVLHKDRALFEASVIKRFGGDMEKATAYVNHIADRQITKAGGILSSTSILAGMSYFVHAQASLVIALLAVVIVASMLHVKWSPSDSNVDDLTDQYHSLCQICYERSIANSLCSFLIILSVLLLFPYVLNLGIF